jgi:site-specific DNA-cytosine methylase
MELRIVGLFAGIGGIELGMHDAGHETVLLCDNDPPRKRFSAGASGARRSSATSASS